MTYSDTDAPAYLLISFTTNKTPGAGDANDSLMIDDVCFIYSSWLTDIRLNGTTLSGFSKGRLNYRVCVADLDNVSFGCTTETDDATVSIDSVEVADSVRLYTFTVTAEDGVTQHIYTVEVTAGSTPAGISSPATARLLVSPNPANGLVSLSVDDTQLRQAAVYDMTGRKMCESTRFAGLQANAGPAVVDLSGFASGTYIIRAVTTQRQVLATAIIKR